MWSCHNPTVCLLLLQVMNAKVWRINIVPLKVWLYPSVSVGGVISNIIFLDWNVLCLYKTSLFRVKQRSTTRSAELENEHVYLLCAYCNNFWYLRSLLLSFILKSERFSVCFGDFVSEPEFWFLFWRLFVYKADLRLSQLKVVCRYLDTKTRMKSYAARTTGLRHHR